jgi:hypothetical protein
MTRPADRAALERLRRILQDPAKALDDIRQHVEGAFRRMYRQRKLVLHGGRANPVALRSCLRTCAPLVGAGMDRIAHNFYVNKTPPLVTVAQNRNAMIMVVEPRETVRTCYHNQNSPCVRSSRHFRLTIAASARDSGRCADGC